MDDLDHQLLAQLRRNARLSIAELSTSLNVSRGTITNRMARLEQLRIIRGYTVLLKPEAEIETVRAWMSLQIEGNHRKVVEALMGEPAIASIYDTNGRWDLLADVRAASTTELSQLLERVRSIKGVQATETSIHLAAFR